MACCEQLGWSRKERQRSAAATCLVCRKNALRGFYIDSERGSALAHFNQCGTYSVWHDPQHQMQRSHVPFGSRQGSGRRSHMMPNDAAGALRVR